MSTFDLGGGGNSFPFDKIGDSVTGTVVNMTEQQQTDMEDGTPKVWPSGQPAMMYALELQTRLRESVIDDGMRTVYLRGSKKTESMSTMSAVIGAVKAATGAAQLQTGGEVTLTFVNELPPSRRGYSPQKQYEASYRPPAMNLDAQQPAPAPAAPAPVAAPPAPAPAAPVAAQAVQMTPEQEANLRAAGIDPTTMQPIGN